MLTRGPRKAKSGVLASRRACPCYFILKTEIQSQALLFLLPVLSVQLIWMVEIEKYL